jgi:hypothetical protein
VVDLTASDVVGFLLRESERASVGAVKGRVTELRSLLRFLHLKGFTPTALASAVPPAAGWHDTGIPVGLAAADVQRLLDGCDRASPTGIRNFTRPPNKKQALGCLGELRIRSSFAFLHEPIEQAVVSDR